MTWRTGIVVGTLGVAGYLKAAEEVRRLARSAGKRTYTLLMGKPNPAKLANFPEVEVFVMIADARVCLEATVGQKWQARHKRCLCAQNLAFINLKGYLAGARNIKWVLRR